MSEFITEKEAKEKKICPFLSIAQPLRNAERNCLGSGCMMWRWGQEEAETTSGRVHTIQARERVRIYDCPNGGCEDCLEGLPQKHGEFEAMGFCGLAPLKIVKL